MSKFCKKCGQKLPEGIFNMFAVNKTHEFDDGSYCEGCAKKKVKEARK